jgi:PKD repeat protein/Tol biopolymer transport system component
MKTKLSIVFCLGIISVVVFSFSCFSQGKIDAYQVEQNGYFTHPQSTSSGIVVSDNSSNAIFLIQNNKSQTLISSPGCGRYYTVSPDKTKIGFKQINTDGMQVPAVFDLQTMKITELADPVDLCGQTSFSSNGKIAYTLGNDLNVIDNGVLKTFPLGTYSNIVPISPDGNFAIYNNDSDQLFIIDLTSEQLKQITDGNGGYMYPQWSPDGTKIAYSSLSGIIMVFDMTTNTTSTIGEGENAVWSDDSQYLFFDVISSENFEFKGSELFMAKSDGSNITQITNTPGINEMYPIFINGNKIVYCTYEKQEIISAKMDRSFSGIQIVDTLAKSIQLSGVTKNNPDQFSEKLLKTDTKIQGDAPYLHQMYDTPDWHHGSGSCAPTTAAMALAYYNRLPYWDITVSSPSSHTSHYGAYVADMYRYNEIYYNTVSQTSGGEDAWGGYGYMWGLGSPNSYMATYIQNHDVTSVHSTTTTFAEVQSEIDQSYPIPICSLLSTAGHLTLTVGYVNGQHTLIFNDPYGDKNDGSWPNYYGKDSYYDWPGYNNGYQNLNTMAWTVTSESSEPVYSDTIIDDVYYNHGFYMYNQGSALMRYYRDTKTGGYNDHFWWTYTSVTDTCYVTWTPNIPADGDYEVSAYIPTTNASATTAQYKVYYDGGNQTVVVNQSPIYGAWVSLGTFHFLAGTSGYVRLGDGTGTSGQKIAFDAMEWVNVSQPAAVASFNASSVSICAGNSVTYTNTSTNATSYSWTFSGGTPATSTQVSPTIVYTNPGTYDVSLFATGPGGSNTLTMTSYIMVGAAAVADYSVSDTLVYLPAPLVSFTNASSNATSYLWDFGDGSTSSTQSPDHTYTAAGDFLVQLVAYNTCGNDTLDTIIHVLNPPPVATFSGTPTSICAGESVQFSNSSTNATSYNWTFSGGNPSSSTLQNPLVVYANPGTYNVSLVATGPGGSNTLTMTSYISVGSAAVADYTVSDTLVYLPSSLVSFTNSSVNATSYLWDFGDGLTSTAQNPDHTYTAAGDFLVQLIAYNTCGNDTLDTIIHVQNPPPVAVFNGTPTSICAGESVQFANSSTNATSYTWTFSGGSPASSTLSDPLVIYATPGTYDVSLIVAGPGGSDTSEMLNYITVDPLANADFVANSTIVYLPSADVVFTNNSSNATSWLWDFGDGSTSTDQNPWHTYTAAGVYTVMLIAYNAQCGNDTLTMTDYIIVDVPTGFANENPEVAGILISPNPASGKFTITYELINPDVVEIDIYDMIGNEIRIMHNTLQQPGKHEITFSDGQLNLSDGIYLVKFSIGDRFFMEKLMYQK